VPTKVFRTDDVHNEVTPPTAHGPIPHAFEASPNATQAVLFVMEHPLLRAGDGFDHTGASHNKPQVGSAFAKPTGVTKHGEFTDAGQCVLFVDDAPVMTMGGKLETCSDATRETTCDAAVLLAEVPPLWIDEQPVLPGNN
jgi:hypothetical protein